MVVAGLGFDVGKRARKRVPRGVKRVEVRPNLLRELSTVKERVPRADTVPDRRPTPNCRSSLRRGERQCGAGLRLKARAG